MVKENLKNIKIFFRKILENIYKKYFFMKISKRFGGFQSTKNVATPLQYLADPLGVADLLLKTPALQGHMFFGSCVHIWH